VRPAVEKLARPAASTAEVPSTFAPSRKVTEPSDCYSEWITVRAPKLNLCCWRSTDLFRAGLHERGPAAPERSDAICRSIEFIGRQGRDNYELQTVSLVTQRTSSTKRGNQRARQPAITLGFGKRPK